MGDVKALAKATQAQKPAQAAVDAITADLNDRSGCGIDGLDAAIRREIRAKWTAIVAKAIDDAVAKERARFAAIVESHAEDCDANAEDAEIALDDDGAVAWRDMAESTRALLAPISGEAASDE